MQLIDRFLKNIIFFSKNKKGATAIEYGLLVSMIGIALLTPAKIIGLNLTDTFECLSVQVAGSSSCSANRLGRVFADNVISDSEFSLIEKDYAEWAKETNTQNAPINQRIFKETIQKALTEGNQGIFHYAVLGRGLTNEKRHQIWSATHNSMKQ